MMMILTIFVVGVSAYIWCIRGFFSALVHMVCVLVAGAVAFGLWEPISYALLGASPDRGFFSWLGGCAWGLGLAIPFGITLAVLRLGVDSLLPANAQCETTVDYVGGGVCGLLSGVITGGMIVLSIGFLRTPSDFAGYKAVHYTEGAGRGSLQKNSEKFIPWVDRITAGVYSRLSLTTLHTGEPLAKWYPDFDAVPGALRMTYEGSSRNTLKPDAFQFGGLWTVGNTKQGDKFEDLLVDTWNDRPQPIADLNGNEMGTKSDDESLRKGYLAGAIVKFKAQAREKTGQVVVGNGQVRMVVARALDGESVDESDTKAFHPIAVVTNVDDPTRVAYARFRFDGDDIYVASLGGVAEAWMGFEFPVPAGYRPIALYIKNVRVDLEGKPATEYASPLERDEMVGSGQISGMAAVGPILDDKGNPVQAQAQNGPVIDPIVLGNSIGFMIQKGTERSLEVAQEGRGWTVRSGELKLRNDEVKGVSAGIDPKLQVNRFSVADDTVVVKVDISPAVHTADYNKLLDGAPKDQSPVLVDTEDRTYPAVGFVYKDSGITWVRFTKGNPISGLGASGMPQLSRSTPDRKLTLVFAVPLGVSIKQFKIGDVVLEDRTAKPIKADQRQR